MGLCDNWWVDSITNDYYALFKLDDMELNYYHLMETIFGQGWTTGEDLFLGSQDRKNMLDSPSIDVGSRNSSNSSFYFQNYPGGPGKSQSTLKSSCYANLRTCFWNQSCADAPYSAGHGGELAGRSGCTFAWPNICVNGLGLSFDESRFDPPVIGENHTRFRDQSIYIDEDDSLPSQYNQNVRAGVTTAAVGFTEYSGGYPRIGLTQYIPLPLSGRTISIVAYNSIYNLINADKDALLAQAKEMNSKDCKEYPMDGKTPGWGGAGYHAHD